VYRHKYGANISWIFASASCIYSIETVRNIFRYNLHPVILDNLPQDEVTKPPKTTTKQRAGRPRSVRIRTKKQTEKSKIKCSVCHMQGNNKATCARRKLVQEKKQ
jgi:hypothetical protein